MALSGVNSNGLNFTGLATGIDTAKVIDGLTALNQKKIDSLKSRQTDIATKQAVFAALQGKLFDLQSKTNSLARAATGAFDGRKASTSDSTALTATAGTAASAGTYTITVGSLAQAQQTASQGYADPNAQIKEGTLTLQVGTGTATTVTVDSRNNTLQGLASSINAAGGDVRASVINDGSATPYRLMLTSTKTGSANTIAVTNGLTAGTGSDINPLSQTLQAADDARVTLGSGPGALTVSSSTNQVNGLIPGVTLNALKADVAKPVTLTVAADTEATAKAVKDFVEAYNGVQDFIKSQTSFDKDKNIGSTLLGNRDSIDLQNDLSAALSASIPGLSQNANRLSSVGLSFDDKNKLVLDEGVLNQALSGQNGATLGDLKKLFALSGSSDNPGVAFVFGTDKTRASSGAPYQVQITSPATRGAASATDALAPSVVLNSSNNSFTLKVNGITSSAIALDAGTYTPAELASQVQQKINANAALNGNLVAVDLDGGKLRITSQQYGFASKIQFDTGSALGVGGPLGFVGTETGTGTDVAGKFIVNGQDELATGSGQMLIGKPGNANTDGLQVQSTLTSAGSANVSVSQGLASRLNQVLGKYLSPVNGQFKTITDTYQKSYEELDKSIAKQNDVLAAKTLELQLQFAAMETAVNNLKGLQTQLSSLTVATYSSNT